MNHESTAQLQIDFRTGRPSVIRDGCLSPDEFRTCSELNHARSHGIKEAARPDSSSRSLPRDVWRTRVANRAAIYEVPLIDLQKLGFTAEVSQEPRSELFDYIDCGREATAFNDSRHGVVYKLFDVRVDSTFKGSVGLKLEMRGRPPDDIEVVELPATVEDMLDKICAMHDAGACPTEIVGLSEDGTYLIAKQPRCLPLGCFEEDRRIAVQQMKAVAPKCSVRGRELWVFYSAGKHWMLSDLHEKNVMRLPDGSPTIIDALIGELSQYYMFHHPKLAEAADRAEKLAKGIEVESDDPFHMTRDEDL